MNIKLQIILIVCSILFFLFILKMIIGSRLELKYSLTWLLSSIIFILLSIFPKILFKVSVLFNIKEPVNAIFLLVIFFLLIITFTLTVTLSKKSNTIKSLVQEVGILKLIVKENTKEEKINRG